MAVVRYEGTHYKGKRTEIGVTILLETDDNLTVITEHPQRLRHVIGRLGQQHIIIESEEQTPNLYYQREYSNPRQPERQCEFPTLIPRSVGFFRLEVWHTSNKHDSGRALHVHETTSPNRPTSLRFRKLPY